MDINFSRHGSFLTVKLKGEIDHHSCEYIRERIDREFIQRRIDSEKDISEKLKFSKYNGKQIIVNRNIEYLEGLLNETV